MPMRDEAKDLIAGTAGGIAQVLVGQPFDIVKVRVQTAPKGEFSGVLDCARHVMVDEGPMAFYKGTTLPLIGVGACVSIQFGVVQAAKRMFAEQNKSRSLSVNGNLSNLQLYSSGALAGIANSVLAGPIEHVRIRLQTQKKGHAIHGPFDCIRQLVRAGGISNVFRGLLPTVLREGHGLGIYFLTYEYFVKRQMMATGIGRDEISPTSSMIYGALSGITLWIAIYPIDIIKSYLQTDAMDPTKRVFRGSLDVVRHVWRTQGLRGFIQGIEPTLVRAPFVNGVTFVAFEAVMRELNKL